MSGIAAQRSLPQRLLLLALTALAVGWGVWLALLNHDSPGTQVLDQPSTPRATPRTTSAANVVRPPAAANGAIERRPATPAQSLTPHFAISRDEPPLPVNERLTMVPSYSEAGMFLGYLVSGRSGDYRFGHGDVITAVDHIPVEDSAAGSELLLIAIAQTTTEITTLKHAP